MKHLSVILLFTLSCIITTTPDSTATSTSAPGNSDATTQTSDETTTKKIERQARKSRSSKREPTILDAVKGASLWVNRWFADLQDNKGWKTTTYVYKSFKQGILAQGANQYFNHQRSYVTVSPRHNRARFRVNATQEFSIYFMQNTADIKSDTHFHYAQSSDRWSTDESSQANEPLGLKNNTIRINIRHDKDTGIISATVMLWTRSFTRNKEERNSEEQRAEYYLRDTQLTIGTTTSYWVWWENTGLILMGLQGKPPFLAYYVNHIAGNDDNGQAWSIRALGFSNTAHYRANLETFIYEVKLDFPCGKEGCTDTFDDNNDNNYDMDGRTLLNRG